MKVIIYCSKRSKNFCKYCKKYKLLKKLKSQKKHNLKKNNTAFCQKKEILKEKLNFLLKTLKFLKKQKSKSGKRIKQIRFNPQKKKKNLRKKVKNLRKRRALFMIIKTEQLRARRILQKNKTSKKRRRSESNFII